MRESGQLSGHVSLLMVDEDESVLNQALDLQAFGAGWFTSSDAGLVEHPSLSAALGYDRVQVFARLTDTAASPGPIIQYLRSRPRDGNPDHLRAGGVSYRWMPGEQEAAIVVRFRKLASEVFHVARSVTSPDVVRHDGSAVRDLRIGRHARNWYLKRPWPDRQLCDESTFATYRLRCEAVD